MRQGDDHILSGTINKIRRESDLDRKARAAAELLAQAKQQTAHIAPSARIAWNLDLLFLFFAILIFYIPLFFEPLKTVLPPGLCQVIEPVANYLVDSDEFTNEVKGWLCCLIGLVALPAVFDVILAAACKHTSPTGAAVSAQTRAPEKTRRMEDAPDDRRKELRRVEDTLDDVLSQLNMAFLPVWKGQLLCILFMLPIAIYFCFLAAEEAWKIEIILSIVILFLLFLGFFQLLLRLQLGVLKLLFSNRKSIKQVRKLRVEFIKEAKKIYPGYLTKEEEQAAAEIEKARRAAMKGRSPGHTIWYTEESSSSTLTDRDHNDLDAVQDSLRDNYGPDWSDGV